MALGRLERMDLTRGNPAVEYYLRCEALASRGLSARVSEMLWQSGDRTLLAAVEVLDDAQLAELTEVAAKAGEVYAF